MDTPILLIAWRRQHTLKLVIDAMRLVVPSRIFIACDGPSPSRSDEISKVAATRELIDREIDWPCKIERLYSDTNQGCRLGVSRAITWFFEHVEEGIILEDDCIPHPEFFSYCQLLLERYRNDNRIWSICGSNFQLGNRRGDASYYFSIHGDSWGWATWRRAWAHYSEAESNWTEFSISGKLKDVFRISRERLFWKSTLDDLFFKGQPDTWDFQWWLVSWMNNGLHVWPNTCLISNCGFDEGGTHTFGENKFANLPLEGIDSIVHPKFILPDSDADEFTFLHRRGGYFFPNFQRGGKFFKWSLRWKTIKSEGLISYFIKRIFRFFSFNR